MIKVNNSKTKELPSGCAYMIANELEKTFRLNAVFSKAEQKTQLSQLEYKKGYDPDNFGTAIEGLEVECRNKFNKEDRTATLVSAVGPVYGGTIVNKMEKLKSAKGKEVTYDAIVENLCKVYRATGSGKGIIGDPSEMELTDLRN